VGWIELARRSSASSCEIYQGSPTSIHWRATRVSTCMEIWGGGIKSSRTPIIGKATFVLLLFIKVAISFRRLVIICLLNCIAEIIQVTKGCGYFP